MKKYEFVTVEGTTETPIPAEDLEAASEQLNGQHGLIIERLVGRENHHKPNDPGFVRIQAEGVMAMVFALGQLEKYRGRRIDAIEVIPPH